MKVVAETAHELSNFRGIDNVDEPHKFPKRGGTFLQYAINCDIDDTGQILRAGGMSLVSSGAYHSAFGDSYGEIFLCVKNGNLIRVLKDESELTLGAMDSDARVDYAEVLDKIFYTNGIVIGYYKDSAMHSIPSITQEFKHPMKAGHLMEWFASRLYVAVDNILMFSDSTVPMYYDSRHYRIPFPSKLTMVKGVADGLYVSTLGDGTFWLAGKEPSEFQAIKITDSYAYLYSAVTVEGEEVTGGKTGISRAVIWTSSEGVYIGYQGGAVKNVTGNVYTPAESDIQRGCAIYRDDLDYDQYIFTYYFANINEGANILPPLRIRGYGSI